jgi:hypothetical protein
MKILDNQGTHSPPPVAPQLPLLLPVVGEGGAEGWRWELLREYDSRRLPTSPSCKQGGWRSLGMVLSPLPPSAPPSAPLTLSPPEGIGEREEVRGSEGVAVLGAVIENEI